MFSKAKRNKIKACLLSGLRISETALQCGVSSYFVKLEHRRLNLPSPYHPNRKASAETIQKIQKLVYQGKTISQVVAACGVSRQSVNKYKKQFITNLSTMWKLNNAKKQLIQELVQDGISEHDTARICKTSSATVNTIKFINDIRLPREKTSFNKYIIEKVQKQLLAGKSLEKIAVDCHVPGILIKMEKTKLGISDLVNLNRLSDDKVDKALQCVAKGMTAAEAAKACGIHVTTVRKICKDRNIPLPRPYLISLATKEKMKRHLEQGESFLAVAAVCDVSIDSVKKFKKTANIVALPSKQSEFGRPTARGSAPRVADHEIQKIKHLLLSGMSIYKVAVACGRSDTTVKRIMKKMRQSKPPMASVVKLEEINQLLAEGEEPCNVAARCDTDIATVKRVINERNIQGLAFIKEEQIDLPVQST